MLLFYKRRSYRISLRIALVATRPLKLAQHSSPLPARVPMAACSACSGKRGFSLGRDRLVWRAGSSAKTDPTAQCLGISNSSSSSRKLWCQTPAADSAFSDISIFSEYLPSKHWQGPGSDILRHHEARAGQHLCLKNNDYHQLEVQLRS